MTEEARSDQEPVATRSSLEGIFGEPSRFIGLRRGSYLFSRGEAAEAIFVVVSGRLRLERSLVDGTPVTLAVLGPGNGVAEAALFAPVYHCDARAEIRSRLGIYPKAEALDTLRRDATGMSLFVRHLAGQVRRLRAILELRAVQRADDRVMAYLDLLEALGETWSHRRPTNMVAAEIGLSPETLYRSLKNLEQRNKIARRGREIWKKD